MTLRERPRQAGFISYKYDAKTISFESIGFESIKTLKNKTLKNLNRTLVNWQSKKYTLVFSIAHITSIAISRTQVDVNAATMCV
jgi:hypothetical protein